MTSVTDRNVDTQGHDVLTILPYHIRNSLFDVCLTHLSPLLAPPLLLLLLLRVYSVPPN
jgi:hypothetical protein